ncbi:MAG: NAD(+)/NADH kinase [Candidatus Hydrogenedentes bacterium]|nr:NAD(+)/NADH kinase [Candidatus Hydrogenedentota bacterium]
MKTATKKGPRILRVALFGAEALDLAPHFDPYDNLRLVENNPDVVVSFGGDGTLLGAELQWPGRPKVPILNSRLGHRCIPHPAADVIRSLAEGTLVRNEYAKLECAINPAAPERADPDFTITCLNEINVHMGRINSAVRFRLWINEEPFDGGSEIIGDGFVACTPFGSTAYFNAITHGIFTQGIGVAFKATSHKTNHLVVAEDVEARFLITRGPATLAFDSSPEYLSLEDNDELIVRRHAQSAVILTCGPVRRLHEPF